MRGAQSEVGEDADSASRKRSPGASAGGAHELHLPDDRFVPLRAEDLIAAVAADGSRFGPEAAELADVGAALRDVVELECAALEREAARRYARFNPDRETLEIGATQGPEPLTGPEAGAEDALTCLAYVLDKANFERLDEVQIDRAVAAANTRDYRVRIDPDRVRRLELWVRGRGRAKRRLKSWRRPIRGVEREVDVYRRLVVVARLKEDEHIHLKLFREIPVQDVEALLPHAEVEMSLFDRLFVLFGSASAMGGVALKILQGGLTALTSLLVPVVIAAGGVAFRGFFGYRNARSRRETQRTKHLYFQNLANNAAVLHTLAAMIADEELKEAILGYALSRAPGPGDVFRDAAALEREAGAWLHERFALSLRFDARDAAETLDRLGLRRDDAVLAPREAAAELRRRWTERVGAAYHLIRISRTSDHDTHWQQVGGHGAEPEQ